ncbi:universal stress protein [Nocardioides sp. NPDC057577]|uniref:universal stress protein n=1 Tax=Nocardioides sp. NPDC057577 TaxID=3346171 RepID=UPI003670016F
MVGRIVVGIDGSEQSAAALDWAIARAELGRASLALVNAYSVPPAVEFYGYTPGDSPLEWFGAYGEELVAAAAAHVKEVAPGVTCTQHVQMGSTAPTIAAVATAEDMIVVGRRGLGAARSAVLGSVSNHLATHAPCPVVVIGEHNPIPTDGPVVVGVDGSEFGDVALRYALTEAALRKTSVRAVTVTDLATALIPSDSEIVARVEAHLEAEAAEIAQRSVDRASDNGHTTVPVESVIATGRPSAAILANATDAQLIVVGSHGKGFLRRLFLGSTSRGVLHGADRPVVIVDAPEVAEDQD